jgi:hypothetical protein
VKLITARTSMITRPYLTKDTEAVQVLQADSARSR